MGSDSFSDILFIFFLTASNKCFHEKHAGKGICNLSIYWEKQNNVSATAIIFNKMDKH